MKKIRQTIENIKPYNNSVADEARDHFERIHERGYSLGQVEKICLRLATALGKAIPTISGRRIFILGSDQGIADEGITPQGAVETGDRLLALASGKGPVHGVARSRGVEINVANFGCFKSVASPMLIDGVVGRGTKNFLYDNAMTDRQLTRAIKNGMSLVDEQIPSPENVLLGIGCAGNGASTVAAAIVSALTDCDPALLVDREVGEDKKGTAHRVDLINNALDNRQIYPTNEFDCLLKVGGFDILGLVGVILRAAEKNIPVLLDGFVTVAAAFIACKLAPNVRHYLLPTHRSGEKGQEFILRLLDMPALVDLEIGGEEGLGAAMVFPLVEECVWVYQDLSNR